MRTNQLKNYLRLLYKQGVFAGDLNHVQQYCLGWALIDERDDLVQIEQDRMKYTILAGDPEIYKAIFEPMAAPENQWVTLNPEEEAEIMAEIDRWQATRDQL
jgi:hypothetical protein